MELKTQEISQETKSEPLKPLTRDEILVTLRSGNKVYFAPKAGNYGLSNLIFIITPTPNSWYEFQLDWVGDPDPNSKPFGIEAPDRWLNSYNYYNNYWAAWGEWQKYQKSLDSNKKV